MTADLKAAAQADRLTGVQRPLASVGGIRQPASLDDALRIIRAAAIDTEGALAVLRALAGNLAQRPMASREFDLAFDLDQLGDQHEVVGEAGTA